MKTGAEQITALREKQTQVLGKTVEFDLIVNQSGQLRFAATTLSSYENLHLIADPRNYETYRPQGWDKQVWIKLCRKPFVERVAIAGSFLAAEVDRLQEVERNG